MQAGTQVPAFFLLIKAGSSLVRNQSRCTITVDGTKLMLLVSQTPIASEFEHSNERIHGEKYELPALYQKRTSPHYRNNDLWL
jgi:hypothetical protein